MAPGAKSSSFVIGIKDPLDVITYTLLDPSGNTITKATAAGNPNVEFLETPNSQTFIVQSPMAGIWEQQVKGDNIQTGIFEALAFVGKDGLHLNVNADKELLTFPETTTLRAELLYEGQRVIMATIAGNVRRPDGSLVPVTLLDDGQPASGDKVADDGIYSARFDAFNEDGSYIVKLQGDSIAGVSTTFGGESHFPSAPTSVIPAPTFTRLGSLTLVIEDVGVAAYCTAKTSSCGTLSVIGHTVRRARRPPRASSSRPRTPRARGRATSRRTASSCTRSRAPTSGRSRVDSCAWPIPCGAASSTRTWAARSWAATRPWSST
jgi:hypothetical protein